MSLRDLILAKNDLPEEEMEVPEWGVTVIIRGLNGRNRAKVAQEVVESNGNPDMNKLYPELLVMGLFDPETKEPVFESADRDAIMDKSGVVLDRISEAILRLSGLTPKEAEAAKNE